MKEEIEELLESSSHKGVVKEVLDNPYIDRHKLLDTLKSPEEEVKEALEVLEEKEVILQLASQANSDVESRVPKAIYLVNPDIEEELKAFL